jgi:hypothetical protein
MEASPNEVPSQHPSTSQEEGFYFAIDVQQRRVVVIGSDYDTTRYTVLDPLPSKKLLDLRYPLFRGYGLMG